MKQKEITVSSSFNLFLYIKFWRCGMITIETTNHQRQHHIDVKKKKYMATYSLQQCVKPKPLKKQTLRQWCPCFPQQILYFLSKWNTNNNFSNTIDIAITVPPNDWVGQFLNLVHRKLLQFIKKKKTKVKSNRKVLNHGKIKRQNKSNTNGQQLSVTSDHDGKSQ